MLQFKKIPMKMQLAIIFALIGFAPRLLRSSRFAFGGYTFANGTATYRDAMRRNQGSSSTSGNRTTYRDAQGRLKGTKK